MTDVLEMLAFAAVVMIAIARVSLQRPGARAVQERASPVTGEIDCPSCAETIKAAARRCRFCGYDVERKTTPYVAAGKAPPNSFQSCMTWLGAIVAGIVVLALLGEAHPSADNVPVSRTPNDYSDVARTATLSRLRWQDRGTRCRASASITNTSLDSLPHLRLALNFIRQGRPAGKIEAEVVKPLLAVGASSPWHADYACPGAGAVVSTVATTDGHAVQLNNPAS